MIFIDIRGYDMLKIVAVLLLVYEGLNLLIKWLKG